MQKLGVGDMTHIFQSLWLGSSISPYEKLCLKSFLDHGHAFRLYTYEPDIEVPKGVEIRDAEAILSRSEYFTYSGNTSPSAFSNLFRYKLLKDCGGWWVDTDVVCLSSDIPRYDYFFAYEETGKINGAVLFFDKEDPLLQPFIEEALLYRENAAWGDLGPKLITRVIKNQSRINDALPAEVCYPIHYTSAVDLLKPGLSDSLGKMIESSLFLHLYNEVIRRTHILKTMLPPKNSLLRQIAEKHLVDGWSGEYSAEAIYQMVQFADIFRRGEGLERQAKATVGQLTAEKDQLSATVGKLSAEKDQLRASVGKLTEHLVKAEASNAQLRTTLCYRVRALIQGHVRRLTEL